MEGNYYDALLRNKTSQDVLMLWLIGVNELKDRGCLWFKWTISNLTSHLIKFN